MKFKIPLGNYVMNVLKSDIFEGRVAECFLKNVWDHIKVTRNIFGYIINGCKHKMKSNCGLWVGERDEIREFPDWTRGVGVSKPAKHRGQ